MSSGSRQPHNFIHTQPKTYHLSFKAFISFPVSTSFFSCRVPSNHGYFQLRLCNPPPAIGKVRSCGGELVFLSCLFLPASYLGKVTPLFNVRLEDVLDRKHLPPLGKLWFEKKVHLLIYQTTGLKDFEVCRSNQPVIK